MHVQIVAYVVLDRLVIQASSGATTPTAREWTRWVLEDVPIGALDAGDARDLLWLAAQTVQSRVMSPDAQASPF